MDIRAWVLELILEPLVKAYGRDISGVEIIVKIAVFLLTLFIAMYGLSAWMVVLV